MKRSKPTSPTPEPDAGTDPLQPLLEELVDDLVPRGDAAPPLPTGTCLGPYRILCPVGAGGMGAVYRAYDTRLAREVAIKLVATTLLTEAQAQARLSHPNVVAVYDVGSFGDSTFIAMELVEGSTLRQWLRRRRRSGREILRVMVDAGRGLAAAHSAGLVHRDFKPENVLIGKDGRVRVADFGLALPVADAAAGPTPVPGTPGYMAPEQLAGGATDARTDQFSFCVTAYEALFGERPGAAPAETGRAARRLRSILLQGLATDPRDRHPSMTVLLDRLAGVRHSWRGRAVGAAAVVALVASLWALESRRAIPRSPCRGEEGTAGIWDPARKSAVRAAFAETPHAARAWTSVEPVLDAYARDWEAMHAEVCAAVGPEGETEDLLVLRLECLHQRRRRLEALVGVLAHADATIVDSAATAARALPAIRACANLRAASARIGLPDDAPTRARVGELRAQLAGAQARFDAGKYADGLPIAVSVATAATGLSYPALQGEARLVEGILERAGGDYVAARRSLSDAVARAALARDEAVVARAATELAWLTGAVLWQHDEARTWIALAGAAIERLGGDGELTGDLEITRGVLAQEQDQYEDALAAHVRARAAYEGAFGSGDTRAAGAIGNSGIALRSLGRYEEAAAAFDRAAAMMERTLGPQHPRVADWVFRLALLRKAQGRLDDAAPLLDRALAIYADAGGDAHPTAPYVAAALGDLRRMQGRTDEALETERRAIARQEQILGPSHPGLATSLGYLAGILRDRGEHAEALPLLLRAAGIQERTQGRMHADLADTLGTLGDVYLHLSRIADARAALERALAIREQAFGREHPIYAAALRDLGAFHAEVGELEAARDELARATATFEKAGLDWDVGVGLTCEGEVLLAGGAPDRALEILRRALALEERSAGREPLEVARTLTDIGEAELALGAPERAGPPLERAVAVYDGRPADAAASARARFALARALGAAPRARALALQSRELFERAGPLRRRELATVTRWLRAR